MPHVMASAIYVVRASDLESLQFVDKCVNTQAPLLLTVAIVIVDRGTGVSGCSLITLRQCETHREAEKRL